MGCARVRHDGCPSSLCAGIRHVDGSKEDTEMVAVR